MGETLSKLLSTIITVVIAVGASAGLWIGANLIFNQVKRDWSRFMALAFGLAAFVFGVLLSGNRITRYSSEPDATGITMFAYWVWLPLVLAAVAAAIGLLLGRTSDSTTRLAIGAGGLGALGALAGVFVRSDWFPELDIVALLGWTIGIAIVGAGISMLLKKQPVGGALIGAAVGWILGAWGAPELGSGSSAWAIIAMAVPAALLGLRVALGRLPNATERAALDQKSRAVIFVGPALLFIFGMLVIPTIRTILLSVKDRESVEFVGFENYRAIFRDPKSWDTTLWTDMFTSRLFVVGIILLALFVVLGVRGKQQTGRIVELGSPSMGPLMLGLLLISFAVFTTVRGTIVNNLWWVVVVTLFSTSLGLAIAVLADGVKFEKIAKSLVFMPMAISLVGASVIWRFMYVARDSSKEQTGVMNALWVGLGKLSTGDGPARIIVGVVVTSLFVLLLVMVANAVVKRVYPKAVVPGMLAALLGWFLLRYWQVYGGGVGGQRTNSAGNTISDPINFIQDGPYNNMWLMVVLIWIQTGFAMVILSAAIKAVPTEYIEAAKVDGATDSQVFWRITLPSIGTTIGVVVTTLIVLVMKVYDIVQVLTNGNFGTEVLANNMYREAFLNSDFGLGAALAILIFVSVLPVMVMNIRRMQKEA
ncbi:MAG: sugar ABC transporter permease [Ilumatobacter sp.]